MWGHKTLLASLGVLLVAYVCRPTIRPAFVLRPPANPSDPPRLPSHLSRRVLVAGGGLAGLSAALELSERGYQVTIREAGNVLGGRLSTRHVHLLHNQTFAIEHGFHAWFGNYHVFADIRKRLGLDRFFKPWHAVQFVFKEASYHPETLVSEGPYPLNLLRIVLRSPNLRLVDAILSTLHVPDLVWFNHANIYQTYDDVSFSEYAKAKRIAPRFYDILYAPSLSVTVNERENLSAAEMVGLLPPPPTPPPTYLPTHLSQLTYNHVYFLSHPRADRREVAMTDHHTAVIGPWQQRLEELGAVVELNRRVGGLHFLDDGTIQLQDDDEDARFDHVVLATNLHGVKAVLAASSSALHPDALASLRDQVSHLEHAPPYKVLRAFFDKRLEGAYAGETVLETPDAAPVNLVAQYHLLEEESARWAASTGGSVLEFHLYTWEGGVEAGEDVHALWAYLQPTVCTYILPELCRRNFTLLDGAVAHHDDFPSFRKGLHRYRPMSRTPAEIGLPGLALAGDWLATDYPSALMERAVATGREAANVVLLQDGVRQVPLPVTTPHGPGLRVWLS